MKFPSFRHDLNVVHRFCVLTGSTASTLLTSTLNRVSPSMQWCDRINACERDQWINLIRRFESNGYTRSFDALDNNGVFLYFKNKNSLDEFGLRRNEMLFVWPTKNNRIVYLFFSDVNSHRRRTKMYDVVMDCIDLK